MTTPREYVYRALVERVVDGDTVDLAWIDKGFGDKRFPLPGEPLRLRLFGIDAFETSLRGGTTPAEKALGLEAKAWLKAEVEGREVRLHTVKGGGRGTFGRLLVYLWRADVDVLDLSMPEGGTAGGNSFNAELIRRGWAVPYSR